MPRLILEARRIAATVIHGLHGRRRAGPGENFWQYRRFVSGEAGAPRRLAPLGARRPSLCARAGMGGRAHGMDLAGPFALHGVRFAARRREQARPHAGRRLRACRRCWSKAANASAFRASCARPASRNVIDKMAEAIVHDIGERASLPPSFSPSPLAEIVMLSDFWSPIGEVHATIAQALGDRRARACRADRRSGRGDVSLFRPGRIHRAGRRRRDHGGARRDLAQRLRSPHRAPPRRDQAGNRPARLELCHPPHRPAGERTSARPARAHGRRAGRHRRQPLARDRPAREASHDGSSARLCVAAGAARPVEPAGAVVAAAAHSAAAAPHPLSADAAPVRHRPEGRDARAHALVAHAACG